MEVKEVEAAEMVAEEEAVGIVDLSVGGIDGGSLAALTNIY